MYFALNVLFSWSVVCFFFFPLHPEKLAKNILFNYLLHLLANGYKLDDSVLSIRGIHL